MHLRPTKRGFNFLLFTIVMYLLALTRPSFGIALATSLATAMTLTAFFLACFAGRAIQLSRSPTLDGHQNTPLYLPIHVSNSSRFLRAALVIEETCPFLGDKPVRHTIPPLGPRQQLEVKRVLLPETRGKFNLDEVSLISTDAFGLFARIRKCSLPGKIIIRPEVEVVTWLPLHQHVHSLASPIGHSVGETGAGQDFFGIREYRFSDGIQHIDWKASAKQRQLMVREYEENATMEVTIILDTNRAHLSRNAPDNNFEYLIKSAASLANHLSAINSHVNFLAGPFDSTQQAAGPAQNVLPEIMEILTSLDADDTDFVEQLSFLEPNLHSRQYLYCLTMSAPQELEPIFQHLLSRDINIHWICAQPGQFTTKTSPTTPDSPASDQTWSVPPVCAHPELSIHEALEQV